MKDRDKKVLCTYQTTKGERDDVNKKIKKEKKKGKKIDASKIIRDALTNYLND